MNKYVGGIHQRGYVVYFRIYEQQTFYTYAQSAHMKGEFCMNNKFIARVAAVAIGAAMLSTAAFAAPNATINDGKDGLNFADTAVSEGQDYVTMMAYAVPDAEANDYDETTDTMIALEQVAATTGLTSVGFDTSKVMGKKNVIVKIGGGESVTTVVLPLATAGTFKNYIAADSFTADDKITVGNTEYSNVKVVTASYKANSAEKEKITAVGATFANASGKDSATKKFDIEQTLSSPVDGDGSVKFAIAIFGIPDAAVEKGVYAFPYAAGNNEK